MKASRFFLWTCLVVLFFGTGTAYAQEADIQKSEEVAIQITKSTIDGNPITIYGKSMSVITPSSVLLKTYKFKLDDETMAMIDFGWFANAIVGVKITHPETGKTLGGTGFLNKAGILTFTIHGNGSDGFFPRGWF